jgi:hypothetical protein
MLDLSETGAINGFTAVISAAALVLVALIGRWQLNGRREARVASQHLHDKQEELAEAVKPSNGHETIGEGVQAIEAHLERIDTRLEEGEHRFDRIENLFDKRGERIEKLEDKASETLALVAENHGLFKNYIEAWTPLAARAVGEWGIDGTTHTKEPKERKDHGRRRDK